MIETREEVKQPVIGPLQIETARVIWDFLGVKHHRLVSADVGVVLGSTQAKTVTDKTYELYRKRLFPWIVCTGGNSGMTNGWLLPEAAVFARELLGRGISLGNILFECSSTNIGENLRNARAKLEENKVEPDRVLIITHHAVSMRAFLSALRQWPGPRFQVAYPQSDFIDDSMGYDDLERRISLVLGEADRLINYPNNGFTVPVKLPERVLESRLELLEQEFKPRVKA